MLVGNAKNARLTFKPALVYDEYLDEDFIGFNAQARGMKYYAIAWNDGANCVLQRAGTPTVTLNSALHGGLSTTDTWMFEVIDSQLKLYKNGTLKAQATDSTYATAGEWHLFDGTFVSFENLDSNKSVTYNANGATGTPPAIQTGALSYVVASGSTLSKTGYFFKNWNTAADGSGTAYAVGSTITPSANVTLYAIFKPTHITIGGSYTDAGLSAILNEVGVVQATTTSNVTSSGTLLLNNAQLKITGTHEIQAVTFDIRNISSIENVTLTSNADKSISGEYSSFIFRTSISTPLSFSGVTINAAMKSYPQSSAQGNSPGDVVILSNFTMTNCTVNGLFHMALDNASITGCTFNYVPYSGHNQAVAIDGSYNTIEYCTFNGTYNGNSSPIAFKFYPQWRQVSCVGNIVRNCTVPNNGHEESLGCECRSLTGSGAITAKTATSISATLTQIPANEKSDLRVGQHLAVNTGAGRGNYYRITAISGTTYTLDTSRFTTTDVAVGDIITIAPMFCDNLFEDIDVVLDNGFLDMGQGCNVGLSLWMNCHGNTVRRLNCTTTKSAVPNYWGMIGQDGGWVANNRIQLNSYNVWDNCTGYGLSASVLLHTQYVDSRGEQLVEPHLTGNTLGTFYNSHTTISNCSGSAYCEVVNYKDVLWENNQPTEPETTYTGILNTGDFKNMSPQVLGTVDWATYYIAYYRDNYTEGDNPYWNQTYNATIPEYVSKGWTGAKQSTYTNEPNWLWSYEVPIGQESQSTIQVIAFTLSYNANGGTGTIEPVVGTYQNTATSGFTRTGYNLAGWNTAADGSGTAYALGESIVLNEDMTLYAVWIPRSTRRRSKIIQGGY